MEILIRKRTQINKLNVNLKVEIDFYFVLSLPSHHIYAINWNKVSNAAVLDECLSTTAALKKNKKRTE